MKAKNLFSTLLLGGIILPLASCAVAVEKIEADVPETIFIGQSIDLNVNVTPDNATEPGYTFASSDENILSVKNDTITGVNLGNATLTLTPLDEAIKPIEYAVSVIHNMPTAISANIPATLTTVDSLPLEVKFLPENATFKEFTLDIDNTDVLGYDPIEKTLTPKALGNANVTLTVKGTEVSNTYPVSVVKGYKAPVNDQAYIDLVKTLFPIALNSAKEIDVKETKASIFNEDVYVNDIQIRQSENAYSSKGNVKLNGADAYNYVNINTIEDNKFITLSNETDNSYFKVKNIVNEVKDSYHEISLEEAKNNLKLDTLNIILDQLDNDFDTKENVANIDTETGDFVITYTTTNTDFQGLHTVATTIDTTKAGVVNNVKFNHSILKDGETTAKVVEDIEFNFTYGEKFARNELFVTDYTPFLAKSFDITYEKDTNLHVGDKIYPSWIKVTNVLPETALNVKDIDLTYEDKGSILDLSGTNPLFIKEGSVNVIGTPSYYLGEKVSAKLTFNATTPLATDFEFVKVDTNDANLKVGNTYPLAAKLTPSGADQAYSVTSSDPLTAEIINENGKYSVKLLKAGEVTLTFKSVKTPSVTKDLKITAVDDKPSTDKPAYVGTYKGKLGQYIEIRIVLNEKDGHIINLNNDAQIFTLTNITTEELSPIACYVKFHATSTLSSYPEGEYKLLFNSKTGKLSGTFAKNGGSTEPVETLKEVEEKDPAYVGTYKGKLGQYIEIRIVLNKKDGHIINLNNDAQIFTLTNITTEELSPIACYVKFHATSTLSSYPEGEYKLLFNSNTGKLSGTFAKNGGATEPVETVKEVAAQTPAYVGEYTGKLGQYIEIKIVLNEKDGYIVNLNNNTNCFTLTNITTEELSPIACYVKFHATSTFSSYPEGEYQLLFNSKTGKLSGTFAKTGGTTENVDTVKA